MAREKQTKLNKKRFITVLISLVLIGGVAGFFIGRSSAPEKTLTVTKTVEGPVYESAIIADTTEVFLYDIPLSLHKTLEFLRWTRFEEGRP